jgi:PTH2 family peptidyl-tRNA hydrolase
MENKSVKQVIVMRKDLNMRKGKLVAQGSHASLGAILQLMESTNYPEFQKRALCLWDDEPITQWLNGPFVKICVSVDSEDELIEIYNQANLAGLNTVMIEDNGLTEFHGVKTKTCIAIGPDWSVDIDKITGNLKLL